MTGGENLVGDGGRAHCEGSAEDGGRKNPGNTCKGYAGIDGNGPAGDSGIGSDGDSGVDPPGVGARNPNQNNGESLTEDCERNSNGEVSMGRSVDGGEYHECEGGIVPAEGGSLDIDSGCARFAESNGGEKTAGDGEGGGHDENSGCGRPFRKCRGGGPSRISLGGGLAGNSVGGEPAGNSVGGGLSGNSVGGGPAGNSVGGGPAGNSVGGGPAVNNRGPAGNSVGGRPARSNVGGGSAGNSVGGGPAGNSVGGGPAGNSVGGGPAGNSVGGGPAVNNRGPAGNSAGGGPARSSVGGGPAGNIAGGGPSGCRGGPAGNSTSWRPARSNVGGGSAGNSVGGGPAGNGVGGGHARSSVGGGPAGNIVGGGPAGRRGGPAGNGRSEGPSVNGGGQSPTRNGMCESFVDSIHSANGMETKRPKAKYGCRRNSCGGRGDAGGGHGDAGGGHGGAGGGHGDAGGGHGGAGGGHGGAGGGHGDAGGDHGGAGGHGRSGTASETCPVIRLLVLGGHGVGKSAITVRYLTRRFIGEYKSQVDIIYRQSRQLDGVKVDLEIIDISSRPGDSTLPTLEIRQCDCYMVVYSVVEKHTFLTANQLLHAIFKLRPHLPRPPITLLGNKQDLAHSRQVTIDEGRTTSRIFGCAFAEVSVAETSEDIVPIFTSLIRWARASCCRCPSVPASLLDPVACACSCRHSFLLDGYTCRLCCSSGSSRVKCICNGKHASSVSRSVTVGKGKVHGRCVYGGTNRGRRQNNERTNRKVSRSSSRKLRERSFSSPLSVCENTASARSLNDKSDSGSPSPSRTTAAGGRTQSARETQNAEELNTQQKSNSGLVHGNLCRSLSSPEAWPDTRPAHQANPHRLNTGSGKGSKREGLFATLKDQEPSLSLLARGRSFMLDTQNKVKNRECSCRSRTKSFKSSGKVEIVNIKKPEAKHSGQEEGSRNRPGYIVGASLQHDKWSSNLSGVKESKNYPSNTQPSHTETNEHRASSSSLSTGCRTPRSPKRFPFDPSENGTVEEGSPSPQGRQRKFSVFGVGRALGHFLSKGSLPDLPRATANICDKFGSLKRTIKKRSV